MLYAFPSFYLFLWLSFSYIRNAIEESAEWWRQQLLKIKSIHCIIYTKHQTMKCLAMCHIFVGSHIELKLHEEKKKATKKKNLRWLCSGIQLSVWKLFRQLKNPILSKYVIHEWNARPILILSMSTEFKWVSLNNYLIQKWISALMNYRREKKRMKWDL